MCVQDANKWADVSSAEAIIHEAQILKKISKETRPHPNVILLPRDTRPNCATQIVHLVGVCMQEEPLLLILGYCLHGLVCAGRLCRLTAVQQPSDLPA